MEYLHLNFSFLLDTNDRYPGGKPVASTFFTLNGQSAYTIYQRIEWTKEEFLFLKECAHYHLSAPCFENMYDKEANVVLLVKPVVNFRYVITKLLMNGVTIF